MVEAVGNIGFVLYYNDATNVGEAGDTDDNDYTDDDGSFIIKHANLEMYVAVENGAVDGIANGERLVLRWCTDGSDPPLKCDGVEATCKCVDHDGNIDRRVDFYTHGFVFENENKEVCLPAGA